LVFAFGALAVGAAHEPAWLGAVLLAGTAVLLLGIMVRDCATAMGVLLRVIEGHADQPKPAVDPSMNGATSHTTRLAGSHPAANGGRPGAEHGVGAVTAALGELPRTNGGGAFPSTLKMSEREHEE